MTGVATGETDPRPPWWRRWIIRPVLAQLAKGSTPDKLAWAIAAGVVLGIFPIMGTPTLLCLLVGWGLGLNQPVMQIFKELVYPLHLILILVFIRMGEYLHGAPLIRFSIPELLARFKDDPFRFAMDFGWAAWHGVTAWALVAPLLALLIKFSVTPALRAARSRIPAGKEQTP